MHFKKQVLGYLLNATFGYTVLFIANFVNNLNKLNIQSAFIVINKPFYKTILSVNGWMFVNFKWFFVDVRWTSHNNWMRLKINSMFLFGTVFTAFISSSLISCNSRTDQNVFICSFFCILKKFVNKHLIPDVYAFGNF